MVAQFHTEGGPFTFTARDRAEFVEAFYRIAQDRANKIVVLTGTGGEFIPASTSHLSGLWPILEPSSRRRNSDPREYSQLKGARRFLV
jgi:hypothetical protein